MLAGLVFVASAAAGPLQDDLKARRARVMSRLDGQTMLVMWSASSRVYSLDVDYEPYRQDSDLLYLTGIEQDNTILVLMPGNQSKKEILFVLEPDPRREHWNGHLLTKEEATTASGVDTVLYVSQFEPFVSALFGGTPPGASGGPGGALGMGGLTRDEALKEFDTFFKAVADGRPKMALLFGPRPREGAELSQPYAYAKSARDRLLNVTFVDAAPIVHALRLVKTPYERTVMQKGVDISCDAHAAGMRTAAPEKFEYQVRAAIEQVYMDNGAMSPGYPSIVGSGPNAMILHYAASNRQMKAGDLLLVDAAANYQGLTGDVTRTYPVSGRFTEAQKDVYRIVLAAQEAGIQASKAGAKVADVQKATAESIKQGLLKLGLIVDATGDQFRLWATHGTTHWIGMDVHDVGDYQTPLEPGMMFTIEPGVYVRQAALDSLPDTPENRALKEKIAPAFAKYAGIGIRIEDSFVVTETGLTNLSGKLPRTIEGVEGLMKGQTSTSRGR
jgi:Xaa-Pro aminopeptidase